MHIDIRTLIRGCLMASPVDLDATKISILVEYQGHDIYKVLRRMCEAGEIARRAKAGSLRAVYGMPREDAPSLPFGRRKRKPGRPPKEEQVPEGRITTLPGKHGGTVVKFGKAWRPHREPRRYAVPGLMGYQSPLAGL